MVAMARLPPVNSTCQRASISQAVRRCCDVMKHMLQAYVPSVLYFYSMLQLFQMNVAKVDHDVAYVAMAVQV